MRFYDRKNEIGILQENERQAYSTAVFTVLTGRRRVGKTSLITHALDGVRWAYLFVSKDSEAALCQKFQRELDEQLGIHVYGQVAKFRDLFKVIMEESTHRHFTIVIDEFQNLYKINPAIFSEIQDLWDRYHSASRINFIVSGSIQSLMKRIFEDANEPLYGRPTSKFTLRPFTIHVLKEIFHDHCPDYSNEDLLCLYMLTGGVAKYVELLMDGKCFTKAKMLNLVCRQDSYFLSEGRDLMNQEFSDDSVTYFSILQLIANGMTRRADIDGYLMKDTGTFLQNLERDYRIISRIKPLLSKPNSKTSAYEISDQFLRFWFRFVCPYQSLIERQQFSLLRSHIDTHYDLFSGRTLEHYFQAKLMESGRFTQVGNWWDRKGENELDIVAINEFDHTGIVAEVKRNLKKVSMARLEEKLSALPKESFGKYHLALQAFSLEDI